MSKKKKILFVIESLVCAGAEKSLVTLLNLIDYSKYEVDLQLFSYGGEFEDMLPKEVNLLPELPYFTMTRKSLKNMATQKKSKKEKVFLKSRLKYSIAIRLKKYSNPQKAVIFWKNARSCFESMHKQYDVAIAYAQGMPTFYVDECIRATKKYAWVNVIYKLDGKYQKYVQNIYEQYNKIICVSDSALKTYKETFPEIAYKGRVIYDINDGVMMQKMAHSSSVTEMEKGKWKFLTVGRFAQQKGYDIALEACKILKNIGIDFCWYVLGRGPLQSEILDEIRKKNIEDKFVLLGTKSNPYPYIANADIYVQTSKFEGFGLAIAEARMLNTPVVTTRFDAVYAQMVEGENGLVVDMNGQAVADAIQRLINEPELYNHIVEYQKQEKKGNYEELEKFYELIEAE